MELALGLIIGCLSSIALRLDTATSRVGEGLHQQDGSKNQEKKSNELSIKVAQSFRSQKAGISVDSYLWLSVH